MATHRVMATQETGEEMNMFEGTQTQCYDWIGEHGQDYEEFRGIWVESISNSAYLDMALEEMLGEDPANKYGFDGDY